MNLIERYIQDYLYIRNFNWITNHLYIAPDQLYVPTFGQQEILLTHEKRKAFLLPRNAGASTLIAMDAITEAMLNPEKRIIIYSHSSMSCRQMANRIRDILRYSSIEVVRMQTDRVIFQNGSQIRILVAEPVYYRGERADVVYIDNFDMVNSVDLSNIFIVATQTAEKILILGNNLNDYEAIQRFVNIN